jgi:hypothetical protein
MFAAYGIDVLDPAVSLRRVWVLAERLPPSARAPGEEWSQEAHLLALVCDHIAQLTYATMRIAGSQNASQPQPIPRPRARHRPQRQQPAAAQGGTQMGTWMEAASSLSGIPGVVVKEQ